ncbi:MAG: DEAD/DEAH box helicase [Clostridiales bacterium]|jgi:ATP-dependent Lhr-like helicase|nr:DEAD/DEAH box helicase [Clostridiales bacterium]
MNLSAFTKLSPFIQNYIYRNNWTELRDVQEASCDVIFNSDSNLLLSTGTASGKTEAAFLPTLTLIKKNPPKSVGILYVSPLKALINDQFMRLNNLLAEGCISVVKWHGEASISEKSRLLNNPSGVLQITPESMESLLINKNSNIKGLFFDTKFIIIDEVHYFMDSLRGVQLLCQLERIQKLAGCNPRRIGLSATLSDYVCAEDWLCTGSSRDCVTPLTRPTKRSLGLRMTRFATIEEDKSELDYSSLNNDHLLYLYKMTLNKKAIIFAKSRNEVEQIIAGLREIAEKKKTRDIYFTHHGSISKALREEAEIAMKLDGDPSITGATVTLELGIDIGALDMVVQVGSPVSVSSFTQRVGRCGRRGQKAELLFTFDDKIKKNSDFSIKTINWDFIKTIAVIELFLHERWIEPVTPARHPYGILYHQTLSYLAAKGEASAPMLAQQILNLSAFKDITQDDYRAMLTHMLMIGHLQRTERKTFVIGKEAEQITGNFEFYSVFESTREYTVKYEGSTIGSVSIPYAPGTKFTLAGQSWEAVMIPEGSKVIFAKPVAGRAKATWATPISITLDTVLVQKMREVLCTDAQYLYLTQDCIERLCQIRDFIHASGMMEEAVIPLPSARVAVFPWLGSRELITLIYALSMKGLTCFLLPGDNMPIYFEAELRESGATEGVSSKGKDDAFEEIKKIVESTMSSPIKKHDLNLPHEVDVPNKYNKFLPRELLEKQYLEDYLVDLDAMLHG